MLRVLRNNAVGIALHIAYSGWASGALYVTNSWIPSQLRKAGMDRRLSQGILLASIVPSLLSMYSLGHLLDRGMPAIRANAVRAARRRASVGGGLGRRAGGEDVWMQRG